MLEKIREQDIMLNIRANDWEDAIRKSAQLLLEQDKIELSYVDEMINALHRVGPYIVLGNHVALAHTRPEYGVKEAGVTFSTIENGVDFGVESADPIKMIITLAAIDSNSHLELMGEIAQIIMEEKNVDKLVKCTTKAEFLTSLLEMKDGETGICGYGIF